MSKRARGLKGSAAELLFEKWLIWLGYRAGAACGPAGRYHRAGMIGGGNFTRRHDLFGVWDVEVQMLPDLRRWCVNVTTLNAFPAHRKDILAHPWPEGDRLSLLRHERVPDPANRGKSKSWWVFEEYETRGGVTRICGKDAVEFDEKMVAAIRVKPAKGER